jgi:hypothetical protein
MPSVACSALWEEMPIPERSSLIINYGPLKLRLRRRHNEYALVINRDPAAEFACEIDQSGQENGEPVNERYAFDKPFDRVRLAPVLPDRSVVVRPDNALKILSGQQALFFVSIPVSLRVSLIGATTVDLVDIPTLVLSNTWFGDTVEGELCYSLKTSAKREIATLSKRPWRAICPITITNTGSSHLEIQRLCVQVKHLSCFLGETQLWTNSVEVVSRGEVAQTVLNYGSEPPAFEKVQRKLADPREPVRQSLLQRGFLNLRLPSFF